MIEGIKKASKQVPSCSRDDQIDTQGCSNWHLEQAGIVCYAWEASRLVGYNNGILEHKACINKYRHIQRLPKIVIGSLPQCSIVKRCSGILRQSFLPCFCPVSAELRGKFIWKIPGFYYLNKHWSWVHHCVLFMLPFSGKVCTCHHIWGVLFTRAITHQ
mgnify:CR=1 FL=1